MDKGKFRIRTKSLIYFFQVRRNHAELRGSPRPDALQRQQIRRNKGTNQVASVFYTFSHF